MIPIKKKNKGGVRGPYPTTQETRKKLSQTEMWGSAITDHAMQENHLIDWESTRIIEKERDDKARGEKEAVHIRILPNMNRDEGRFHLSHLYDDLLGVVART